MATAELPKGTKLKLDLFFTKLKQRRAGSTVDTARETVELLRSVVASSCWKLTSELLGIVRSIGQDLVSADPLQLSIGNVVRRVLFIIREEYVTALKFEGTDRPEADSNAQVQSDKESRLSLANLLVEQTDGKVDFTSSTIIDGVNVIKSPIIEEIIPRRVATQINIWSQPMRLNRLIILSRFPIRAHLSHVKFANRRLLRHIGRALIFIQFDFYGSKAAFDLLFSFLNLFLRRPEKFI